MAQQVSALFLSPEMAQGTGYLPRVESVNLFVLGGGSTSCTDGHVVPPGTLVFLARHNFFFFAAPTVSFTDPFLSAGCYLVGGFLKLNSEALLLFSTIILFGVLNKHSVSWSFPQLKCHP